MSNFKWKKFFNLVAYIALVFIGISILLSAVVPDIAGAFLTIALVLSVCVVAFYAFFFAYKGGSDTKGKWSTKQIIYLCVWIAAVVISFVGIILLNV